ncbi:MAG: hypothetical protein IT196_15140 [Acidimicrobiales bacterium]|nr:hypothetical protein [Acidimicrobiales bacterium]
MSHMVIYRSVDGKPGFQQTDDLVSAVEFVERLRNLEGVESARIYRLEQVNFRFQPYYQVHLDTDEAPTPPPLTVTPAAAPVAAPAPAPEPVPAPVAEPAPAVSSAAMAAAESSAVATQEDQGTPTLGATPAPEPSDGNGIRRGLFGR